MKKVLYLSILVSAAIIPCSIWAESLPAPIIGIVEQATLDKSEALKSIVEQVESKRTEIQKEMAKYEAELKTQEAALADQQKKVSAQEFATKRQAFEKRVHEIQEKIEVRRAQMELAVEEAKKKVFEAFLKITNEEKIKNGANIIMYKETIITANPEMDLSTSVLERLNQVLPRVTVVFKSEAEVKKQLQQQPPLE